ncbi:MAG: hypothetical protein HY081_05295 [Gammaproteobacteria bacterium]|nr:hypothetical protein [Gammaproteobacteria bacterium]
MSQVNYYSMRQFSPYQGTAQVVETPRVRAISSDGISWRVQFLNRRSRSTHAIWRADGSGTLLENETTQEFLEAMQNHPAFPFPAGDNLELWLLDAKAQKPLAILASTLDRAHPPRAAETVWQAALAGDDSFMAPSLMAAAGQSTAAVSPIAHREVLRRCVQKAAGPLNRTQWFRRAADGGGTGLHGHRLDASNLGRKLEHDTFPELLLRAEWDNEREKNLVHDYHDWQAPYLLTHCHLARATRDRLERAACRQAEKLYKLRHFLPEIINPDLLKVAFVEAVIRRAGQP